MRLLSGQIEREQNQPEPRADSVHKLPYGRYGEEDAVGGATENYIDRYTSTGMNQSFSAVQLAPELSSSESRAGSLPRDSVRQESVEDSTLADEQYLTTLASPSISNRNRGRRSPEPEGILRVELKKHLAMQTPETRPLVLYYIA